MNKIKVKVCFAMVKWLVWRSDHVASHSLCGTPGAIEHHSDFPGKHPAMLQLILKDICIQIYTSVCSQVIIPTAE